MAKSPKTKQALKSIAEAPDLSVAQDATPLVEFRAWLRSVRLAATNAQFDLDDVDDLEDRQTGVEEASQKVGGLLRECEKLDKQCKQVIGVIREIEREVPKIAERIGVSLED